MRIFGWGDNRLRVGSTPGRGCGTLLTRGAPAAVTRYTDVKTGNSLRGRSPTQPRGVDGPRVLIIGCGADVVMWRALLDFLGGSVSFVDDSQDWAEQCRDLGANNLHVVK